MLKHIVLFKFKEKNKKENLIKAKEMLEALLESLPTLKSMEVGINISQEERAMDLSLYSEFENEDDLKAYSTHPEHLKVVEFIKNVTVQSKVSDYTI